VTLRETEELAVTVGMTLVDVDCFNDALFVTELVVDELITCDDEIVVVKRGDADTEAEPEWVRVTLTLGVIVAVEEIDIVNRADTETDDDTVFDALAMLENESETDNIDDAEMRGDEVALLVFNDEAEFKLVTVPVRETETLEVKVLVIDTEFVPRGDTVNVVEVVEETEARTVEDSVAEIRGDADKEAEPE
jgi:hypothetical protein